MPPGVTHSVINESSVALLISCVGRKLVLGEDTEEENEQLGLEGETNKDGQDVDGGFDANDFGGETDEDEGDDYFKELKKLKDGVELENLIQTITWGHKDTPTEEAKKLRVSFFLFYEAAFNTGCSESSQ